MLQTIKNGSAEKEGNLLKIYYMVGQTLQRISKLAYTDAILMTYVRGCPLIEEW